MNFYNIFGFIASVIAICSFLFQVYKKRTMLGHALAGFREHNKEAIQKIDTFIEPYKTRFNVLWETCAFLVSIFTIFAGSVIAFTAYVIEQKTFIQSFVIFSLYLALSYSVKYMGRLIKL